LQTDADTWMQSYNAERMHSGRHCYGETPLRTFIDSATRVQQNSWIGSNRHPARLPLPRKRLVSQIESRLGQFVPPVRLPSA